MKITLIVLALFSSVAAADTLNLVVPVQGGMIVLSDDAKSIYLQDNAFALQEAARRLGDLQAGQTLQVFYAVQLNAQAYDAGKQVFPVYGRAFSLQSISFGRRGATGGCIELDRKFDLQEFPVPADQAEGFLDRNRDRPKPTFGAKVFIGVNLTVVGETVAKPGRPVKCGWTARVNSIDGFEFVGMERSRYADNSASPGGKLTGFYDGAEAAPQAVAAKVSTPFRAQAAPEDAGPDAKEFELLTKNGLVLLSPGQAINNSFVVNDQDALANLSTYADFLTLRAAPDMFANPYSGQCLAGNYPNEFDYSPYVTRQGKVVKWKGDNEFATKRAQQAFYEEVLPKLSQRASATPQRFLLIAKLNVPEYDFTHSGFRFNNLTPNAKTQSLYGRCTVLQAEFISVAQLDEFWSLDPAKAEALLLSMQTDPKYPGRNLRYAYLASEVELQLIPTQKIEKYAAQHKLVVMLRTLSSTLYKDAELTQVMFKPNVVSTRKTVLETGPDGREPGAKRFEGQKDLHGDMLAVLKANGDLSAEQWAILSQQQQSRDEQYYLAYVQQADLHSRKRDPRIRFSFDEDYVPFFPSGFLGVAMTGRPYDVLIDKHKAWFRAWSKKLASK